jgi:hypothetical protein
VSETHACHCGKPAPDTHLCTRCAENARDRLLKIADRWPALTAALQWRETPTAGPNPPRPRLVEPDDGAGNATGLVTNGQASRAMTKASSLVWYVASVLRDDYDDRAKPFNPPATNGSMDDVPKLARWIAMWHMDHIVRKIPDEGTVEAIAGDIDDAERAVYAALHPRGEKWASVNLGCTDHATTDLGERVPCPGHMWAKVGGDLMPDLVCDHDPLHVIEPGVWERQGWKARLSGPLHVAGMARLARRLAR